MPLYTRTKFFKKESDVGISDGRYRENQNDTIPIRYGQI